MLGMLFDTAFPCSLTIGGSAGHSYDYLIKHPAKESI